MFILISIFTFPHDLPSSGIVSDHFHLELGLWASGALLRASHFEGVLWCWMAVWNSTVYNSVLILCLQHIWSVTSDKCHKNCCYKMPNVTAVMHKIQFHMGYSAAPILQLTCTTLSGRSFTTNQVLGLGPWLFLKTTWYMQILINDLSNKS